MNAVSEFMRNIRVTGQRRPGVVKTTAMRRAREFIAYDCGEDTFIFEKGITRSLDERPSLLVVAKRSLGRKVDGHVMTLTTGNHSVAALPLLDGRFWRLAQLPSSRRGAVLSNEIVCGNVVNATIELSQREVSTQVLIEADEWLRNSAGFGLEDVVMVERNVAALDHYRRCGQEWRVKPLAWTETEMKVALAASRKHIATKILYYHAASGVHFLAYPDFSRFVALAQIDPEAFRKGLRELVDVYEGHPTSFMRLQKHRGHHEIELFGIRRGDPRQKKIIEALEALLTEVVIGLTPPAEIAAHAREIETQYRQSLSCPEFADDMTRAFIEAIYMYVTGEIYAVSGEGTTPAFDDRRTALPGVTFVGGTPVNHPGEDIRTKTLLENILSLMSKDEQLEYANVYELRSNDDTAALGQGKTREIVYKTSLGPLERALVEKRLSRPERGYGSYMLARVEAFKALGVGLSEYRLLRRGDRGGRMYDFYIRRRCDGEPLETIPQHDFRRPDDETVEDERVVLALAMLMGDAAAQNMAMKKFDPKSQSPLFGVGKEIYDFDYDIVAGRDMPQRVSLCSVRGSLGWPCRDYTDENFRALAAFYMQNYAHALKAFQRQHNVAMDALAGRFFDGFDHRSRALAWQLSVMRDRYVAFKPNVPAAFAFDEKWRFAMWAIERQAGSLSRLREIFLEKVKGVEIESLRSDSQSVRFEPLSR